jgi:PD-(D/E)XK nuclease superfamily protein
MAATKKKGDLAELRVACDLVAKGYRVALPFGEDCDYDLILDRDDRLERVQVKYASSKRGVIAVRCQSHSLTNGKVRRTKRYTPATVDWIAVYDPIENRCYYVPSSELGTTGRTGLYLRVIPTRNHQRIGIHYAEDYESLDGSHQPALPLASESLVGKKVEPAGLEPATSRMQTGRSPN